MPEWVKILEAARIGMGGTGKRPAGRGKARTAFFAVVEHFSPFAGVTEENGRP
ncbi:protein of unknown function [Methylacidimicrobium sp. AP8]|uniref:hypothetical protein n=1 Tax=Methylacidimicrobium sp. AP8 TaxID=2730359 RepID=UPI0018C0E936|nr:hypothetical protein [Methylacidimicrobium sp. AP8]CAB4243881.1 protein of unknown function [Methylacidimicrobium sp. AP8]